MRVIGILEFFESRRHVTLRARRRSQGEHKGKGAGDRGGEPRKVGAPPQLDHGTATALDQRRRPRPELEEATSVDEVASTVAFERPSLRSAAAPDGTVTILFSDIEGSTALNERLGDVRRQLAAITAEIESALVSHPAFDPNLFATGILLLYMQLLDYLAGAAAQTTLSRGDLLRVRNPSPVLHSGAALLLLIVAVTLSVSRFCISATWVIRLSSCRP